MPDSVKKTLRTEWEKYKVKMDSLSKGENMLRTGRVQDGAKETSSQLGYPLTRRLGWQTKNKPVFLGKRMILPLYSDGFDCSLFAISDNGKDWTYSNPVLGGAGIQPTIAIGKDSTWSPTCAIMDLPLTVCNGQNHTIKDFRGLLLRMTFCQTRALDLMLLHFPRVSG